jgi:hypothetical protein
VSSSDDVFTSTSEAGELRGSICEDVVRRGGPTDDLVEGWFGRGTMGGGEKGVFKVNGDHGPTDHGGCSWAVHDSAHLECLTLPGVTTLSADDFHLV